MNLVRILAIAANCFQETIRDRVLYFLAFYGLLLAIAWPLLREISANTQDKIFLDFGLGVMSLFGALVAIFIGTGLINKEIEKRTVLVLIPKPISRAEFILGKHLGLSAVLGVMVTGMTVIYLALLSSAEIAYSLGSILIAVVYLFLQLALIIAVAIVFGVFTSSILAILFTFGVYLMGNFTTDLVELVRFNENPAIKRLIEILYLILPDLSRLDLKNEAVYGLTKLNIELLTHGLYGIFYTVVLLAIAILIFAQREF